MVLYDFPEKALEEAWRSCLENGDMPAHFSAPEYFREPPVDGRRRFAILVLDEAQSSPLRILGTLTGFQAEGIIKSGQSGTPQICVDKSADLQAVGASLAEGLLTVAKSAELATVFSWFRMEAFSAAGFRETEEAGTAALDLRAGAEKTFSRIKARSEIRQSIALGVQVRQATEADLPEYYRIQKNWSEQKKIPCPSFEVVQESFRSTGSNRVLFIALHDGKIIAGSSVRFYPGAIAEYAWNVSVPESKHLRPNDLLQWRIIEWACQQGIHTYLLGATHSFLLKYSDRIIPSYQYTKDQTLLRTHLLKDELTGAAVGLYRRLPPGVKKTLKQLRGLK